MIYTKILLLGDKIVIQRNKMLLLVVTAQQNGYIYANYSTRIIGIITT